jgi:hypothetical protein
MAGRRQAACWIAATRRSGVGIFPEPEDSPTVRSWSAWTMDARRRHSPSLTERTDDAAGHGSGMRNAESRTSAAPSFLPSIRMRFYPPTSGTMILCDENANFRHPIVIVSEARRCESRAPVRDVGRKEKKKEATCSSTQTSIARTETIPGG